MEQQNKLKNKEFLKIAVPAVLEGLVTVIITTIDTRMISVLGKPAISAVSFTVQPKLIFFSFFFALGTALSFFVAQAYGKKDEKEANYYFHTILKITIILAILLGILLMIFARPVMMLCNRQPDTLDMSVSFFRIIMGFMIFQALSIVLNAALRGIGKTKVTFFSNIAMGVTDIIFNYLLIEGHLGFPRLEVKGDAIATVMGTAAACTVSLIVIFTQSGFLKLKGFFKGRIFSNRELLGNIVSKAGNIVFENLFMRIGFLISSIIVSRLSTDETAVYAVAMLLLNYSFACADGIQSAVVALTGRSYGAKDYSSFGQYSGIAVKYGLLTSFMLTIIYISTAKLYFGGFFQDQASIRVGFISAIIVSGLTFMQIIRVAETAMMRGMGEVKDPRRIATVCVAIVNPGLSYLLAIKGSFGIWGIWLASAITQGLWMVASIILSRIHRKRLKNKSTETA